MKLFPRFCSVPSLRQRSYPIHALSENLGVKSGQRSFEMIRPKLAFGDALQVGRIIVKRIVVHVMDMVSSGNWPVKVLPNLLVQANI